jgi:hypothetical protein
MWLHCPVPSPLTHTHSERNSQARIPPLLLLPLLQVINVDQVVTENHLGRIDMQLCDVTAQPGDNKCITLKR